MPDLILASGSAGRRQLLQRLQLPFRVIVPGIEESRRPGESPLTLAERLSREKALAVAGDLAGGLVIGSDQVADCNGELLGKPGTRERAIAQLLQASGRDVTFWTGLALANAGTGIVRSTVIRCDVHFRDLSAGEIARYVDADQPLECAGSFRAESLGTVLFRRLETDDPTSLVGLPLIALCEMLRAEGIALPAANG
ncbi:MAG: Maf family protein [Gammaproteobacteria bacterium]